MTAATVDPTVDEIAAQWRIKLADAELSSSEKIVFEEWLRQSPDHRAAYTAIDEAWTAAAQEAGDAQILAMREAALRYVVKDEVRVAPTRVGGRRKGLAAAAVLVVAMGGLLLQQQWNTNEDRPIVTGGSTRLSGLLGRDRTDQFQTAVGQRSALKLVDGSTVTLNTSSRIEADFSGNSRVVRLVAGQALFDIAKDPRRPFTVLAGDRKISVLGTRFDVRVESRQVRITLVTGKVSVASADPVSREPGPESVLAIQPGEQMIAHLGGTATVRGTDVQRDISWRDGRLIFKGDRLADAIAEMNRYSTQPIVIADASIGELKLSGVYRTGQPEAFAEALSQYFPVAITHQSGATVLSWLK